MSLRELLEQTERRQDRDEIRERMQTLEAIAVPHRSAYQLECTCMAPAAAGSANVSHRAS